MQTSFKTLFVPACMHLDIISLVELFFSSFFDSCWASSVCIWPVVIHTRGSSDAAGTQAMWCVIWCQSLCLQPLNIAPWCHGGFNPFLFSASIFGLIGPCRLSDCRRGGAGWCQILILTCVISRVTVTQPGPHRIAAFCIWSPFIFFNGFVFLSSKNGSIYVVPVHQLSLIGLQFLHCCFMSSAWPPARGGG